MEERHSGVSRSGVRSLLIVTPHFPPINGADVHRVRMSLPHYAEFGWEPRVLAVEPSAIEQNWRDDALLETVPSSIPVRRVGALPVRWTRPLGLGAIGLRAWPQLYRAGCRWIREQRPDLVFISTTAFPLMTLGRAWRKRFGVPYVLDMQDPWVDEDAGSPATGRGWKHRAMDQIHQWLEPYAMRGAGGLISVSPAYIELLHRRYPRLRTRPAAVLGFGASRLDFQVASRNPRPHEFFKPGDELLHGVIVGVVAPAMTLMLQILFAAFRKGLRENPALFERVRLHFIGTNYAHAGAVTRIVEPLAAEYGLENRVQEHPARVPYFMALQLQAESTFIVIPGSEEGSYVPSKLAGALLANRPVLAVFHRASPGVELFQRGGGGKLVTFDPAVDRTHPEALEERTLQAWQELLTQTDQHITNGTSLEDYEASPLAKKQCELFERVIAQDAVR